MPESALLPFAGWESFYVIAGSSAAALTGLNFVVIAVGTETQRTMPTAAVRAYTTPTIVHFCLVLLVSAILSAPWHAVRGASLCLTVSAAGGLAYACIVTRHMRRQSAYAPVLEDWVFHSVLPIGAYAALLASAMLLPRFVGPASFVIAGVSLLLLYIGIHNAWDSVTWMASERPHSAATAGGASSESVVPQGVTAAERPPAPASEGSGAT